MRRELTCVTVATDGAAGARVRGGGAGGGAAQEGMVMRQRSVVDAPGT